MPENGIDYVPRKELLSYEEMLRLTKLLVHMGVTKVRITGGEPMIRKGIMDFLRQLSVIPGLKEWHLTTNGVETEKYLPELNSLGLKGVNLSLDTLNRDTFQRITRRNHFDKVISCFHSLLEYRIPVKVNMVVMRGINEEEIIPMAELSQKHPISVRFLEEMPFNGFGMGSEQPMRYSEIFEILRKQYPMISKEISEPNSTSENYRLPGAPGSFGIIASYSRTFCGTCNRIRITPEGQLKTCLYDNGVLDLRKILRESCDNETLKSALLQAFRSRKANGIEVENENLKSDRSRESMSSIGG
jgi:cyclic pyranopterin phosphate synthase